MCSSMVGIKYFVSTLAGKVVSFASDTYIYFDLSEQNTCIASSPTLVRVATANNKQNGVSPNLCTIFDFNFV